MTRTVHIGLVILGSVGLTGTAQGQLCFGPAELLPGGVNTEIDQTSPELSADGLTLVYTTAPDGVNDLYWATRPDLESDFGEGVAIPNVNGDESEQSPSLSTDELELYFQRFASDGLGFWDLMVATRASTAENFGEPTFLGSEVNTAGRDGNPHISADGLTLYFYSELSPGDAGTIRLFVTTRLTADEPWEPALAAPGPINDHAAGGPAVTEDELTLFFNSEDRPGGIGEWDIWMATRDSKENEWGDIVNLGPSVNTLVTEQSAFYSEIEQKLYLQSDKEGDINVYTADLLTMGEESIHNLTQVTDHPSVQCAINGAMEGDEIEVDPGTYVENLDFLDKDIALRSTDPLDVDVVTATIIDGGGVGTVVVMSGGAISGFTITGGSEPGFRAGGVHATGTAVVSHNVITGNETSLKGGGVTARDTVVVRNNWISDNFAVTRGGGVNARDDSQIIGNIILFNSAVAGGGGIWATENATIRNNTIVFNASFGLGDGLVGGGGILAEDNTVVLNNIIAFSTDGVGLHEEKGVTVTADYNLVFDNDGGEYGGDAEAGDNDLNVDPLLDIDGIHLTADSPCIDTGDPDLEPIEGETDIDGEARIANGRVDIGCDEFGVCEGDANGDGLVNPLDSGFVLARFGCSVGEGNPNCDAADVNGDGLVNPLDSGFVLARFGTCQ